MAGRFFTINTPLNSLGTSQITVLRVAATTVPLRVLSIMATFQMATSDPHPRIVIRNQDDDGTGTSVSPEPTEPGLGVVLATAAHSMSTQPTNAEIVLPETLLQPSAPFRFVSPIRVLPGLALGIQLWQATGPAGTYRLQMVVEE